MSQRPISAVEPISSALDRTRRTLFRPFDAGKWFVLGFCAWLAWLGSSGPGGAFNWRTDQDDARRRVETAWEWTQDHLGFVLVLVVILAVAFVALVVLFTWLSSRGKLMFLDCVVRDRAAVVEPWERFRTLGDSLFAFRLAAGTVVLLIFSILVAPPGFFFVRAAFRGDALGWEGVLALLLWIALLVPISIAVALLVMATNDFIVPILWLRGGRVGAAWSELRNLVSARLGVFVLYVLLKVLFAVAIGLLSCCAICATCCIAALPYIGVVILLPLYVFRLCYSIEFLAQFGPEYAALLGPSSPPASPVVPPAGGEVR